MKFAAYVPELVMSQIEAVYIYNANLTFRNYAYKLSSAIRIFSHIKVQILTLHMHIYSANIGCQTSCGCGHIEPVFFPH